MTRSLRAWLSCAALCTQPCVASTQVRQQGSTAAARAGIERSWQRIKDYARRGDAVGMASMYTPDGIVMEAGMATFVGRDAIRAAYQHSWGDSMQFALQHKQTSLVVSGDVAVDNGTFGGTARVHGSQTAPFTNRYLEIWRRVGKEWLLLNDVSLPLPGAAAAGAASGCAVQGTWAMESVTVDGKPEELGGWRQIKMVAGSHFTWVGQRAGPASLQSVADSLTAYRNTGFGGGSYRVTDSTYTEHIEFFSDPAYVGRDIAFSCRIVGDRWYHTSEFPEIENGREVRRVHLQEVWRRIQ